MAEKVITERIPSSEEKHIPTAPAYFLSLTIENIRCFGPKQILDLSDGKNRPAPWTIILGDNGVGKTTLLQSLVAVTPARDIDPIRGGKSVLPRYMVDWQMQLEWANYRV